MSVCVCVVMLLSSLEIFTPFLANPGFSIEHEPNNLAIYIALARGGCQHVK